MYWLSLEKAGYLANPFTGSADHRWVSRSKTFRMDVFQESAAMKRPSGDQRGDHVPADPGTTVTCRLSRSRSRRSPVSAFLADAESKTIFFPSGDQSGSPCLPLSSGRIRLGMPPSEVTV